MGGGGGVWREGGYPCSLVPGPFPGYTLVSDPRPFPKGVYQSGHGTGVHLPQTEQGHGSRIWRGQYASCVFTQEDFLDCSAFNCTKCDSVQHASGIGLELNTLFGNTLSPQYNESTCIYNFGNLVLPPSLFLKWKYIAGKRKRCLYFTFRNHGLYRKTMSRFHNPHSFILWNQQERSFSIEHANDSLTFNWDRHWI